MTFSIKFVSLLCLVSFFANASVEENTAKWKEDSDFKEWIKTHCGTDVKITWDGPRFKQNPRDYVNSKEENDSISNQTKTALGAYYQACHNGDVKKALADVKEIVIKYSDTAGKITFEKSGAKFTFTIHPITEYKKRTYNSDELIKQMHDKFE